MSKKFLPILIILLFFFLLSSLSGPKKIDDRLLSQGDVGLLTVSESYNQGKEVQTIIKNNTSRDIEVRIDCPGTPLKVYKNINNSWQLVKPAKISKNQQCTDDKLIVKANEQQSLTFKNWTYSVFSDIGRYQIRTQIKVNNEEKEFVSNEFSITPRSFFGIIWQEILYRPILNTLIFLISIIPGKNLGLAIIALTIIIRLILYLPSQRALRSQKKMQEIQPKLKNIQEEHKGNQEKIAMETMRLWKEHKVNPFGSCLPLLIQMPILIALFYVIQDGLNPDYAGLLYAPLKMMNFDEIQVIFLGILNLSKNNLIILPIIVGALQFAQMKMTMTKKPHQEKDNKKKEMPNEMEMVNNMMIYFMPPMIAIFTASLPAGVGLYWGTSTLFGIIQQMLINKEKSLHEPKVKVID